MRYIPDGSVQHARRPGEKISTRLPSPRAQVKRRLGFCAGSPSQPVEVLRAGGPDGPRLYAEDTLDAIVRQLREAPSDLARARTAPWKGGCNTSHPRLGSCYSH